MTRDGAAHLSEHADVVTYYAESWGDYLRIWIEPDILALHFGYWDSGIRNHAASLERMNRVVADRARLEPGARVLDAGCGIGGSALWLAERCGASVDGISLCGDQVERAANHAADRGLSKSARFHVGDYCATEFPDATFDVVWAQEAVCHAPDKRAFLEEAFRVLKPGGRIVVEDYLRCRASEEAGDERLIERWLRGWAIPHLPTREVFEGWARGAGFEGIEVEDLSPRVRRSLRRLHTYAIGTYPLVRMRYALGYRSEAEQANFESARLQWRAFRRGLWYVSLFAASKPR